MCFIQLIDETFNLENVNIPLEIDNQIQHYLSLRRQPNLTLQSMIIDLIQEETLLKNQGLTSDNTSSPYIRKNNPKYNRKPVFNRIPKKFFDSKG